MRSTASLCAALLAAPLAAHAEFSVEVDAPAVRVVIPGLPQLKMDAHPSRAERPNLRLLGLDGPYLVTLNTPHADAGMLPQQCANIIAAALARRPGAPAQENITRTRLDPNTYAAMYVVPKKGGQVQLNAHLISAGGGTHCVELHVAMVARSKDEAQGWFGKFAGARIEAK
jgi:hypothetical protein